jgi:hypothetical protein
MSFDWTEYYGLAQELIFNSLAFLVRANLTWAQIVILTII